MILALQSAQGPMEVSDNPRVAVGGNAPPDPHAAFSLHLDDLEETARQYLDGKPIETEEQAEDVSRILSMARKAGLDADDARKLEKKPHDDATKAVQERWKPILAKADLITATAKQVLAPWLTKLADEQRAAADAKRQEAERLAEVAAQTARDANPDSLTDQTALRHRQEAAAEAVRAAARLDRAKPQARGGERAVGLRSYWSATVTDPVLFGKWAWEHRKADCLAFFDILAKREATGPKSIPGLTIHEDRRAV